MRENQRQQIYFGTALIVLGIALYLLSSFEGFGRSTIFFLVGAGFLGTYFYRREFGLLIPGCLICGMGVAILGSDSFLRDFNATFVGLGGGFVAITLLALANQRRFHAWPLIPGVGLILLGIPDTGRILQALLTNWPLLLVGFGILIIIGAFRNRATPPAH